MKIISFGTDVNIFREGSAIRERQIEYGKVFDELNIIVFNNDCILESAKISNNVRVYPTNSKFKPFYIFDYLRVMREVINKIGRENLVITTQDPFEIGFVGIILKFIYKVPLQIQIHTDYTNRYFWLHSPLNFIRFLLSHVTLSFADSVRVVSARIAKHIQIEPKYLTVLPVEVRLKEGIDEGIKERRKEGKIRFLTVARLEREKDIRTAIKAFKKVVENGIDAEFTIVGDGSERKSLEKLTSKLNLKDKVKFLGWKDNSRGYYRDADIYVSTSLYEGYGMSTVEAALFGLPLILSNTGLAGDIFNEGSEARIVKPRDINGFSKAMIELADDEKLRQQVGENAKKAAKQSIVNHDEYLNRFKISLVQARDHFREGKGIFKKNILARYLVAGFTGAGTQIGLLYILTDILGIWYLYSSLIAFVAAIIVSFILQKFWTFGDRAVERAPHQFVKYFSVALCGIIINTVLMYLLVDQVHLWYILAQIIVGGVIAVFNFIMYKFFVFRK